MRKPVEIYLPTEDLPGAIRQIQDHLRRLYDECSDHRTDVFHLQELSHGQSINIGGFVLTPTRNRKWLEMSMDGRVTFDTGGGVGANARSSLNAKVYSGGNAPTDVVFDLTVGGTAGIGYKSGTTRTVVNAGKEVLDITVPWGIVVAASGGAGNAVEDITLSVTYEDYVPYFTNHRTTV